MERELRRVLRKIRDDSIITEACEEIAVEQDPVTAGRVAQFTLPEILRFHALLDKYKDSMGILLHVTEMSAGDRALCGKIIEVFNG